MSLVRLFSCAWILTCLTLSTVVAQNNEGEKAKPNAGRERPAVTGLPKIDRSIHDAMQDREYGKAVELIDAAIAKQKTANKDYLVYLKGIAQTEADEHDAAIATFKKLVADFPESDYRTRARFGHAHVLVLQRDYLNAGVIYKAEAKRLLSRDRKDELASVYLEFADRYYEGVPSKDPAKTKKPDFKQALVYYKAASELGPSNQRLQKIHFRIARCHEKLGKHQEALNAYQKFLRDYDAEKPELGLAAPAEMEAEVRLSLGAAELELNRPAAARRTWRDFVGDWQDKESSDKIKSLLAEAEYRIPHTYGMPTPGSVGQLELGVAASEAFVKKYPDHKLAAKTELEIAQAFAAYGRNAQASTRLAAMIANPVYADSDNIQIARRMLGRSLWAQQKHDDAISAWKEFLDQHPTDPEWPKIQKLIVDVEYDKAQHAQREERYAQAREIWQTFLNKYPLDARAPGILYRFGEMKYKSATDKHQARVDAALKKGGSAQSVEINGACKKLFREAISDWRRVVAKYPNHQDASRASFVIATTLEDRLDELKDALEAYKAVNGSFKAGAAGRIKRLTTPQLAIATERKFRSDEEPVIKLSTRNLENVTVKVYRIDMTDYFRKMHWARGIEDLDIALIDPDLQFDYAIKDYQQYQRSDQDVEIPADGPGVTAVTVTSEELEATTMVIVSDLDIIAKTSRNEMFLYAQNMLTGKPAPGTSVLISNGSEVFAEEVTGKDGILKKSHDDLKTVKRVRVFAVKEGHIASTRNDLNGLKFAQGLTPKGYLYTDRPAYQAGQLVNIKGIVRWVQEDRFTFEKGAEFKLDVYDSRGRQLQTQQVQLNEFGTVKANMILPDNAPQGSYRIHLHRTSGGPDDQVGALSFETRFIVAQYKLEPIEGTFDIEKQVYFRGDEISGEFKLAYYYGSPLANEEVQYQLFPGGELQKATTDDDGKIKLNFETKRFAEAQPLKIRVQYPARGLSFDQSVFVATRGFAIGVSTVRNVFIGGETFEATFHVADPAGDPVATPLKLEVFRLTTTAGRQGEVLVQTHEIESSEDAGKVNKTLSIKEGGNYIVRATGVDQFGNDISGQSRIQISGDSDAVRLRILAKKFLFDVGETPKIDLHWREKPTLALVTFEGAQVLGYRLIELKTGKNALKLPIEADFAPNFFLSVAVMQRNEFHAASSQFRVAQKLKIAIKPSADKVKPGEDLKVDIQVTDARGKPVSTELSLAMIQANLLERYTDAQVMVDQFFADNFRSSSVRQSSSCTFKYQPKTRLVSAFLIAEGKRRDLLQREALAMENLDVGGRGNVVGDALSNGPLEEPFITSITPTVGVTRMRTETRTRTVPVTRMQTETRTRTVPVTRMRTELRNGVQVQVPYTEQVTQQYTVQVPRTEQVTQNYTVQVPYTEQVAQNYSVQVPYTEQVTQNYSVPVPFGSAGQRQQAQGYARGEVAMGGIVSGGQQLQQQAQQTSQSYYVDGKHGQFRRLGRQNYSVNGLTSKGKFMVLNGRTNEELETLVTERGIRLLDDLVESETAFWSPVVTTDEKGLATLTIAMPDRSTAWQLRGKAISVDTLAGQASVRLTTQKDLFGDMKLPQAFTVGDSASVPVEIHHLVDKAQAIDVKLTVTQGDKTTSETKRIDAQGPGISKLAFPVEVQDNGDAIFELTVSSGDDSDVNKQVVIVRPYGFPVFASASENASQSTVAMLSLDEKLKAKDHRLEISIGPNIDRTMLETVLGNANASLLRCGLPSNSPIERSISDLIGGVALMEMIGDSRDSGSPQSQALIGRITSSIANLISSQRDDGGWNWSGKAKQGTVDQLLSARVMWALSTARKAGFIVAQKQFDKGKTFLKSAFSAQANIERQTILLHAMTESECGDFAYANRLYRERNRLSISGLSHLALALSAMKHPEMAREITDLIKIDDDRAAHLQSRGSVIPWIRNDIELRALYMLALQACNPQHADVSRMAKWLVGARVGSRWPVEKANGPTIAALAKWQSAKQYESEKYTLTIAVNDRELKSLEIDPKTSGSIRLNVDPSWLYDDAPQRIEFKLGGRATFSYSALLTAFVPADDLVATTKDWSLRRRYEPAQRLMDGRVVPRGFGVVSGGYNGFTNPLTQLPVAQRTEVTLSPRRLNQSSDQEGMYDYLVLTEPIPAGCTVLDGTVRGQFERHEIEPGKITFYIGDRRSTGDIRYTLIGYSPGEFTAPQSVLRSFYDPAKFAISTAKELKVLPQGQETVDEYKLTPDELFHFGQRHFDKQEYQKAHDYLSQLVDAWRLDSDKYKAAIRSLFQASLKRKSHADIVKYFEIIKERFPDVELSFEGILQVAESYGEIGEYERSYLVYRATVEGSFERESQIAGFLDSSGQFLRSIQTMESLLRDYPAESYVATATYALAQEVYRRAPESHKDAVLVKAGATRIDLINASLRMLDHFVTTWPEDPANDQASFALATGLIDLDLYKRAIERCDRYAKRYADSRLVDSFWYMTGYCHFELKEHEKALTMCRKVANAKFPVAATGATRVADNKWEAIYIMGQIHHSLGSAADAIKQYTQVEKRFADAAEAIKFFSRKEIRVDEVTAIKPDADKQLTLYYRNVATADLKVYRIDLMKFGLMQRNLDRITAINLAGIKPYHEATVKLGDGQDFADREKQLDLPLKQEGAYLIVARGENIYASGLVLVSPLELLIQEDQTSGRVRVSVKDSSDDSFVSDVEVKVIGSANDEFQSGKTDLRGLFIADDVQGTCTAIAVRGANQYAFYRGSKSLGKTSEPFADDGDPFGGEQVAAQKEIEKAPKGAASGKAILRGNMLQQNIDFQREQKMNYDGLLNNSRKGVKSDEAY